MPNPTSYARFLHAIPDVAAVDIYLNDYPIQKNIKYKEFTRYFTGYSGIYNIKVFKAGETETPFIAQNFEVDESGIYTVALTGLARDPAFEIIPDYARNFDKNKAHIRFINLAPFNTDYNITLNEKPEVSGLTYKEISDYAEHLPGNYYFRAFNSITDDLKLSVPRMQLKAGKIYSGYIVGLESGKPGLQLLVPLEGATYLK